MMYPPARLRLTSVFGLVALGAVLFVPTSVHADPIYAFGRTRIIPTGSPDPEDLGVTIDPPIAFVEHHAPGEFDIPVDFTGDRSLPGDATDPAGRMCDETFTADAVTGTFVFTRPADLPSTEADVLVFFGEVLGVSHQRSCAAILDAPFLDLESRAVTYPESGGLEFEAGDALAVFGSGRTLWHRMHSEAEDWDGYRVYVQSPPADDIADIKLQCPPRMAAPTATDDEEVTFTVINDGGSDAPDVQVVFRIPNDTVVAGVGSDFECDEHADARVYVCTFRPDSLGITDATELTVALRSRGGPVSSGRIVGFASGAVHDFNLLNNECITTIVVSETPDAGITDSGAPADAGTAGDATIGDAGEADSEGAGAGSAEFRGAGGCTCDGVGARSDSPGLPLFGFGFGLVAIGVLVGSRRRG